MEAIVFNFFFFIKGQIFTNYWFDYSENFKNVHEHIFSANKYNKNFKIDQLQRRT